MEQIRKAGNNTYTREVNTCTFCGFTRDARCPACGKRCNMRNKMNHLQRCCTLKQIREVNTEHDMMHQIESLKEDAEHVYVIEPLEACANERKNNKEALAIIGQTIQGCGQTIQGYGQTIQGYGQTIQGYRQTIQWYGAKRYKATGKTVQGYGQTIQGYRQTIQWYGQTIQGHGQTVQGYGQTIQGYGQTIQE